MALSERLAAAQHKFDQWARYSLFRTEHQLGTDLLEYVVDIHLEHLYRELNLNERLLQHDNAVALAADLGFVDSARIALDAMLMRLSLNHDFLSVSKRGDEHRYLPIAAPRDRHTELTDLLAQMQALGPEYVAPLEFLEFGAAHFVRALRDDHTFMDRVLTGQENEFKETWHRATNTDPLQDVHGIMGGKAVELLFDTGTILEVGGGTGNGIRNNLQHLDKAGRLDQLQRYVFTDVSMPFIFGTRRKLTEEFPAVNSEWRLLNINKDFEAQRVEANSADMIYGVNAAHIAKHTVDFMVQCKRILRPGGLVVFSERIRRHEHDMAPREITLNLSSYHRTAAIRHPEYRPCHAYLARDHWIRACELAGFREYRVWPSAESVEEYFPNQYAAVIVAGI